MDIWPVSWTKWVIGEREKENQSESAIETQGDRMFIYCRLEPHSGCEWKAVLSRTSHPLQPNSTHRQCSTKEGLHTVTKSPQAHTHTLSESISTLHTQTESLKLLLTSVWLLRHTHTYRLNLQFPHTHTHSCLYQHLNPSNRLCPLVSPHSDTVTYNAFNAVCQLSFYR